jgi:hypothetical protein
VDQRSKTADLATLLAWTWAALLLGHAFRQDHLEKIAWPTELKPSEAPQDFAWSANSYLDDETACHFET